MNCTAMHFPAMHYNTLHCTALHCTAIHHTALHCTELYCISLHSTELHGTALHSTALHCTALHCTALLYTALHCTAWKNAPKLRPDKRDWTPLEPNDSTVPYHTVAYRTLLNCTDQRHTGLKGTVLYWIKLKCSILHSTVLICFSLEQNNPYPLSLYIP